MQFFFNNGLIIIIFQQIKSFRDGIRLHIEDLFDHSKNEHRQKNAKAFYALLKFDTMPQEE